MAERLISEVAAGFRDAIRDQGLEPPEIIEPGTMHRFPGVGKKPSNRAGWCRLFPDGKGGMYGDWSTGLKETWFIDSKSAWEERKDQRGYQLLQAIPAKEKRKCAETEQSAKQTNAAQRAVDIWAKTRAAPPTSPYLIRKHIQPHGARIYQDALVLPVMDFTGKLTSLQFISPIKDPETGRDKTLLKGGRKQGCYIPVAGDPSNFSRIIVCEGWATGCSLADSEPDALVLAAIDAGNLKPVAEAARQKWSDREIMLCADDDAKTDGNPGLTKAHEAALSIGAKVASPNFGDQRPEGVTDFNDLAQLDGLEAVKESIRAANDPILPGPQPLTGKVNPEPYPLDALPDTLRAAVEEVQAFVKAPSPLIASSALEALSLAGQPYIDVKRDERLCGPTSLFILVIADSGERKSTCDQYFMEPIKRYEEEQRKSMEKEVDEYNKKNGIWESKFNGLKDSIRNLSKRGESTDEVESEIDKHMEDKPKEPKIPQLIYVDITPEALAWNLKEKWSSAALITSEGGQIFGSHGMKEDSIMNYLTTLNQIWDGGDVRVSRRTKESFILENARMTFSCQVQESTLLNFLDRSKGLARGTGFMSRFLLACPESTKGRRFYTEPPKDFPALSKFQQKITYILNQPVIFHKDKYDQLKPNILYLSPEAKKVWINFYNLIEKALGITEELSELSDIASKAAENIARLAALFHLYEHGPNGDIGPDNVKKANRIVAWYLNESKRFLIFRLQQKKKLMP